jgi:hypothetical protein
VYDRDYLADTESNVWPKVIQSNRKPNLADVDISLTKTFGIADSVSFSLIGNPYPFEVDWEATLTFASENIDPFYYVWDASNNRYQFYGAGISINGGTNAIKPYQGFWAGTTVETSPLSFKKDTRIQPVGGEKQSTSGRLALEVFDGKNSEQTRIQVVEPKARELKALQLAPLSADYTMIYSRGADGRQYDVQTVKSDVNQVEIPIRIASTGFDSLVIRWPELTQMPNNWEVILVDEASGKVINLLEQTEYVIVGALAKAVGIKQDSTFVPTLSGKMGATEQQGVQYFNFVLKMGIGVSTSIESETLLPQELTLAQNYPNPFNPSTQIRFGLPQSGQVNLTLFDVTGRKVTELMNDVKNAGWHELRFDASRLSSGIYFYQIRTAQGTLTKKMMLVK